VRDGEEIATASDPAAATGEIVAVVRGIAELLGRFGARLTPGDIVITGSVFPPVPVGAGHYEVELPPLGALSVDLTG
jgi:2-keto-4-pentenoate hydratase